MPWTARLVRNLTLRLHCRTLVRAFQPSTSFLQADQLREPIQRLLEPLERYSSVLTTSFAQSDGIVPALLRLATYQHLWIREPENWVVPRNADPASQFRDLIDHLLVHYELPEFYYGAWFVNGNLQVADRDWFCHVAQGGNIRRAPNMFPFLGKRAAHLMHEAPRDCTLRQALRYGQLRALGMQEAWIPRILTGPGAIDFAHDATWLPLFAMMTQNPSLDPEDIATICEHVHAQIQQAHPKTVSLKGRTLAELLRSAHNGLRDLLKLARKYGYTYTEADLVDPLIRRRIRTLANLVWEPMNDLQPFEWKHRRTRWQIVELCSQHALYEEGRDLSHCVSSYGVECRSGISAMFSLRLWLADRQQWERCATIEVEPKDRRIVQVRGFANQAPEEEEVQVIQLWARTNQLRWYR